MGSGGEPVATARTDTSAPSNRNLLLRVVSALLLAPLAVGAAYLGEWPFALFWGLAALAVWWEWVRLIDPHGSRGALVLGASALVLETLLAGSGRVEKALLIVLLALLGVIVPATKDAKWVAGGIVYASALLLSPLVLRADAQLGIVAILLLFAVVWSTDIGGYFGGRAFGGPKLAPAISPKKTWSGAIVGTVTAIATALALAIWQPGLSLPAIALLAGILSAVSQAGDLFESFFKRRFGAKDASGLIPGHGGVMDRLDGFIVAASAAAVIGVVRGGFEAAATGAIVW
jgi:phosphatidate cytidylyltransferase